MISFLVLAAITVTSDSGPVVRSPYKMGDWSICKDGSEFYSRNAERPLEPPAEVACAKHGGLRAYGPGRRLNEHE